MLVGTHAPSASRVHGNAHIPISDATLHAVDANRVSKTHLAPTLIVPVALLLPEEASK